MLKKVLLLSLILLASCAREKVPPTQQSPLGSETGSSATANCDHSFNTSHLCISMEWSSMPTDTAFGSFTFKTYRANLLDGTPVQEDLSDTPQVILWMPAMGHGSSPVSVERIDTGTYRASNVFFVMPGDWLIEWQIKQGSVVQDEATLSITI